MLPLKKKVSTTRRKKMRKESDLDADPGIYRKD